eukprot:1161801-Pelagomonas_calceolata.AAC.9
MHPWVADSRCPLRQEAISAGAWGFLAQAGNAAAGNRDILNRPQEEVLRKLRTVKNIVKKKRKISSKTKCC